MTETPMLELPPVPDEVPGRRRFRRFRLVPVVPVTILTLLVIAAVFAPLVTHYDPLAHDLHAALRPPAWADGGSSAHIFGTDQFGRDVYSRLVYGARASFSVAACSLSIAVIIGTFIGVVAGYFGGRIETLLMRLVDVVLSLPIILVALVVGIALGPSFKHLVLVVGLLTWPQIARLIRSETLLLKRADFVRYSRAMGVPSWLIILRHILPNILSTLIVAATLEVAHIILLEASLSFLGAGLPPPTASWGVMIADGRALIATGWWIALTAGLAITISVLTLNTLGDWLRDRLDPRLRNV